MQGRERGRLIMSSEAVQVLHKQSFARYANDRRWRLRVTAALSWLCIELKHLHTRYWPLIGNGASQPSLLLPSPRKGPFTDTIGISDGIASVLVSLVGGAFSYRVSWRWCFYIDLPTGGVSGLIIPLFFHAPSNAKPITAT